MSRVNCGVPIYALTPELATYRRLALYRDVFPILLPTASDQKKLLAAAERKLLERGRVSQGDVLVVTVGDSVGLMGSTNTLKIIKAGEGR